MAVVVLVCGAVLVESSEAQTQLRKLRAPTSEAPAESSPFAIAPESEDGGALESSLEGSSPTAPAQGNSGVRQGRAAAVAAGGAQLRRPAQVALATGDTWAGWPGRYTQSLAFESGSSGTGSFGRNLVVYSKWSGEWSQEYMLGLDKSADSATVATTISQSGVATVSQSETTSNSGSKNPWTFTIAGGMRQRLWQGTWMMVYWGGYGGLVYTTDQTSKLGTVTKSTANITVPDTYTVTESGVGDSTVSRDIQLLAAARVGTEFYIKWFPQLALGFAGGLQTGYLGKTTTTTKQTTQTYTVTSGVAATPSSRSESNSTTTVDNGLSSATFVMGGQQFNAFGNFSLKYVW